MHSIARMWHIETRVHLATCNTGDSEFFKSILCSDADQVNVLSLNVELFLQMFTLCSLLFM